MHVAPRRQIAGRRRKLLLAGASVCVALVVVVVADVLLAHRKYMRPRADTWIRGVHVPDERLGWRPSPGSSGEHRSGNDFEVRYEVDAEGFRSSPRRGHARRRIYLFGDSYTFGHGIENADTWANQMARVYLAEDVHVYNAGASGYGIEQMLGRLLEVEAGLAPADLVIFAPTPQDIARNFDDFRFPATLYHRPSLRGVQRYPVYRDAELTTVSLEDPWLEIASYFFIGRITREPARLLRAAFVDADMRGNARAMLADARRRVQAHGARFELFFLPETHESRSGSYSVDVSGFEYHDVSAFFPSGAEVAGIRFADDSHWNAAGHAIAARAIVSTLLREGALGPQDLRPGLPLDAERALTR